MGPIYNLTPGMNIPYWNFSSYPEEQPLGNWHVLPSVWTPIEGCGIGTVCPVYPAVVKSNTTTIVCATVIPIGVVLIALCVWGFIYYKKNGCKCKKCGKKEGEGEKLVHDDKVVTEENKL